jgi:PAS domain S-box-containing protein
MAQSETGQIKQQNIKQVDIDSELARLNREIKEAHFRLEEETRERAGKLEKTTKELEDSRAALMNMLEDVEDAKKKEEEEKNKTLTIISNLADGLLVFDEEEQLFLANPKIEFFFGIKAGDLIGRTLLELNSFPSIKPLIKLLGGSFNEIFKKELSIKDNLILEVSVIPMQIERDKSGKLVILHDITREKFIEKTKSEFVSLAAHQLRTPVSATKWTLRMLSDGDLGKITKKQKKFIEKTYESNERMIVLIDDLLNITKIEEGRYLFDFSQGDFKEVVASTIKDSQEEISRKKILLKFEKPKSKLPKINMDAEKMKLAVQNFIDNAVKYTSAKGKITISLKYDKNKKRIIFSIKDNGIGIPEKQHSRVFSKFFRGVNVVKMDVEGTGLGLFIAKNIIEAHGGKTWFESKEGKGSTFYIVFSVK